MKTFRRAALLPLVAVMLATGAPQAIAAADNVAVSINTKDDSFDLKLAFKISRSNGEVVDQSNGAAAVSSCERCRTVAVAVQVLIATGTASAVTPENLAIALNQECDTCATYAGAFQLVVTPRTQMHFTEAGNARIDEIRADLQALMASASFGNSAPEIDAFNAQVRALFHELVAVVDAEMVLNGGGTITTDVDLADAV